MTEPDLRDWLDAYGAAWESRDPEAAAALFTDDALYHETPFDPPAEGPQGVRRYWTDATGSQREVEFEYEIMAMVGERSVVRWWATFVRVRTGARVELDGVFLLDFSGDGRCRTLREWWHSIEHPPKGA